MTTDIPTSLIRSRAIAIAGIIFFMNGLEAAPPRWPDNGVKFSNQESNRAFPEHPPGVNDLERVKNLDAHRRLTDQERKYVLALCDYLIDKRYEDGNRESAARLLGIYGHSLAIPALLAVIRDNDDSMEVRVRAIYALGQIRDERCVMYLVEDGFGTGDRTLIMATWESLGVLVSDVPDKLETNNLMGYRAPPGAIISPGTPIEERLPIDREKLKKYIDVWRQWWAANHEEVQLRRPYGRP